MEKIKFKDILVLGECGGYDIDFEKSQEKLNEALKNSSVNMEKDLTTLEDIMKLIRKWKDENGDVFFAGFFAERYLVGNPKEKIETETEVTSFASGDVDDVQIGLENLEDLVEEKEQVNFGYLDYSKEGEKKE